MAVTYMPKQDEMVMTSFLMPERDREALQELAERQDRTMSAILRRLIRKYLSQTNAATEDD